MTLLDIFRLGGPVMWLLLVTSIVALSIIFDRCAAFFRWRQRRSFVVERIEPLLRSGDWAQAAVWSSSQHGPFSSMAQVFCKSAHCSREVREDLLRREGLVIVGTLDRGLRRLAMIAQISTLLGLLGTFHVMIMRVASGEAATTSLLATSSVWECFLTTMFGLLIAIPCSLFYQLLEERLDLITIEMDIFASQMEEWRRDAGTDGSGEAG